MKAVYKSRLTAERVNGIRTGYWSPVKKDELIQKLGPLEHHGERLLGEICDRVCRFAYQQDELPEEQCEQCPVEKLAKMLEGE